MRLQVFNFKRNLPDRACYKVRLADIVQAEKTGLA